MGKKFNGLTPAQEERLDYLIEELAESVQAAAKILRHGLDSYNPTIKNGPSNRKHLAQELGQAILAIELLCDSNDIDRFEIEAGYEEKLATITRWMHHQNDKIKLPEGG